MSDPASTSKRKDAAPEGNPLSRDGSPTHSSHTGAAEEKLLAASGYSSESHFNPDNLPDGPQLFQPLVIDDAEERRSLTKNLTQYLSNLEALKANFLLVVRYAREVPFPDLREAFTSLLEANKDKLPPLPPPTISTFVPLSAVPSLDNPDLAPQFEEIFLQSGRVSHLDRICAFHPTYLEKAFSTFLTLMHGSGPLTKTDRLFLGILSAARFECRYVVDLLETDFLVSGGDPSWLSGWSGISAKLKGILEINAILCHRPWLIRSSHFEALLKANAPNSWSVAELVHAVLIMATTRSIAATVLGSGVCQEVDSMTLREKVDATLRVEESPPPEPDFAEETEKLQQLLRSEVFTQEEEFDVVTRLQEFEKIAQENETPPAFDFHDSSLSRYNEYSQLRHADFEMKGNKLLLVQDFGWAEQGFEIVNRYIPAMAVPLDEQFTEIYNLTYRKFNSNEDIDTLPFRRGLWYYVLRVKGVFFDDYNYQKVNTYLPRNTKGFIKKMTCYPSTINLRDFNNLGVKLDSSEKVHICLLASEAGKQAELLWALEAITQAAKK